jgi:hypothetical protein
MGDKVLRGALALSLRAPNSTSSREGRDHRRARLGPSQQEARPMQSPGGRGSVRAGKTVSPRNPREGEAPSEPARSEADAIPGRARLRPSRQEERPMQPPGGRGSVRAGKTVSPRNPRESESPHQR